MSRPLIAVIFVGALATGATAAAEETPAPPEKVWANDTEFNLVFTEGNSNTTTVGFKNTLLRRWSRELFRLKLEALKSANSDDWFEQVDAGYTWLPGETPTAGNSHLVKPPPEPDAENYFAEARFDRTIHKELNWNVGASWDRNEDAGILSRSIVFGGLGNLWRNLDTLELQTSYGLSWTDRQEETPDPEKEERFFGLRMTLNYLQKFGKNTTLGIDWTANMSLADAGDWSSDLTTSLSVSMSKRLSLRVGLRFLYNSEPALEDVDLVARVELIDPDGVPGSGDEYFQTVSEGGHEIVFGETRVRKETLDAIFTTGLVVSF
jgi:putative salt-induced outer membrane protein YdiY